MTHRRRFTIAASRRAHLFVCCGLFSQSSTSQTSHAGSFGDNGATAQRTRVLERVATLDGFINANINAQVQGYIVSRDYKEGSIVKKGDLLFQIDPRPFEAALAQAKGTQAKDQANWAKADADQKRAIDLFNKKVISDQERDTATAAAGSSKANVEADDAAVKQAEINLGYTKIISPRLTVSLDLPTIRSAIWSGQGSTGPLFLQPCRRSIRSRPT